MNYFNLEIVTPTRIIDEGEVSYVRCPGLDGSFGVMKNHREGIIALGVGEIKVDRNGKEEWMATSGGFVEITHEKVQMLLESIEKSEEIDTNRAEDALKRAKKRKSKIDVNMDDARMDASLMRAINRLKVAKR
ncbi:MAG: ATP synthase F1 subunit epsilon [Candidatus Marinimicrobia bacterium]|nr:ATP synthase F1 subunit epsilon [Candidatus Neomarinimicrobiota bacterium]